MWTSGNRGRRLTDSAAIRAMTCGDSHFRRLIDDPIYWLGRLAKNDGDLHRRHERPENWRGQCASAPEEISVALRRYASADAKLGIETGAMTPWLVHELRDLGFDVVCLDAGHARAALKMQINKTDQNDAEGLAQIVRTGWYRSVHVKSFDSRRARAVLGARTQLVGMTTRLSNHIRGLLKTFGLLPGAMRGLPFDRKVEVLLARSCSKEGPTSRRL
jgi:transposase